MKKQEIWILVKVCKGIPVSIKGFTDFQSAVNEEEQLRQTLNLQDDETGIFQLVLGENIKR